MKSLLHQAGIVLQNAAGWTAVLSAPVVIKDSRRSLTLRCRVTSVESGISSVIIKQIKEEPARGFSDWAGAAFLSGLPEAHGTVPHFYGGDIANGLYLVEDLGEGKTLEEILRGADATTAHAALTWIPPDILRENRLWAVE